MITVATVNVSITACTATSGVPPDAVTTDSVVALSSTSTAPVGESMELASRTERAATAEREAISHFRTVKREAQLCCG